MFEPIIVPFPQHFGNFFSRLVTVRAKQPQYQKYTDLIQVFAACHRSPHVKSLKFPLGRCDCHTISSFIELIHSWQKARNITVDCGCDCNKDNKYPGRYF